MSVITPGRVVHRAPIDSTAAVPVPVELVSERERRRIARTEVEAHLAAERPLQSLASFCMMLAGLLIYAISVKLGRASLQETS